MTLVKAAIRSMGHPPTIVMVKGVVTAVDKDTDTCDVTPIDGTADFLGVLLEALDNTSDGRADIVRYPEINSFAIIGLIDNNPQDTFLIKASRYESVYILIAKSAKITASGNGAITVDASKVTLNGGKNKGLVNITPLVKKITNLEKKVNNLLAVFKAHTHTGVTTGIHVSGPTVAPTPAIISPLTRQSDLEDTNILH